jgi:chromosome partitioning protein
MTIIAIVSQKGGSGKTTLSVNLAAAAEAAGAVALIIDTDPQATASQWGAWRADKAPEVIDSAPPRIQAKVDAAKGQGATFIVIDTPPHADSAASRAVEVADLVLIPCRPSAFDLARSRPRSAWCACSTSLRSWSSPPVRTMRHACMRRPSNWSRASGSACPNILPDRAVYRHASAAGASVVEFEPEGKAAAEIAALHIWTNAQVTMPTTEHEGV